MCETKWQDIGMRLAPEVLYVLECVSRKMYSTLVVSYKRRKYHNRLSSEFSRKLKLTIIEWWNSSNTAWFITSYCIISFVSSLRNIQIVFAVKNKVLGCKIQVYFVAGAYSVFGHESSCEKYYNGFVMLGVWSYGRVVVLYGSSRAYIKKCASMNHIWRKWYENCAF